jgi:hypothetical protein
VRKGKLKTVVHVLDEEVVEKPKAAEQIWNEKGGGREKISNIWVGRY